MKGLMTNQQHSITPPPELVQQWLGEYFGCTVSGESLDVELALATQAANWGADQELEACYEWIVRDWTDIETADNLRAARRPKLPSLKEQGMQAWCRFQANAHTTADEMAEDFATIHRALQQLDG